jgi:benzoyl-CoA-dihydrodiol lyase
MYYNAHTGGAMITFDTRPEAYKHWRLASVGPVVTLTLDVAEEGGLSPSYRLKLNSYDLGVDIELADALNRIRFEHPEVRVVILTSGKERVFSSGANIYMLGQATHAEKVNFCKFSNETRNGMEDSSARSGLKFIAAINGACAGGGYELALACDEIVIVDDRSTTVSLPEVPLLGVLPGTGGLTRLVDKRKVRRDLADVFCTTAEGVRADRAKAWNLVDWVAPPARFHQLVEERARALAEDSDRPADARGIHLAPLEREISGTGYRYRWVLVETAPDQRVATVTVTAPDREELPTLGGIIDAGAEWWPLAMARELDDALLMLRANNREIGTLVLKTRGDPAAVLASDQTVLANKGHWFVRETIGLLRRTLQRLETSSRSLFAVIDEASCFAGSLFEPALAADRSYMLTDGPRIALSALNFSGLEMVNGRTRLATRFNQDVTSGAFGTMPLDAAAALELGLVTFAPDELDWEDEIRLALEERASLSPDALTGMEANLRFIGNETIATKIFGRLSAWQNWIFTRPNATGERGALKRYGSGERARFDWERV